jgi:hypothetical protein
VIVAGLVFAALLGGGAHAAFTDGMLILCESSANGIGDRDVQFVLGGGGPFTVSGSRYQRPPDRGGRQPDATPPSQPGPWRHIGAAVTSPAGKQVNVTRTARRRNDVAVIDPRTNRVVRRVPLEGCDHDHGL